MSRQSLKSQPKNTQPTNIYWKVFFWGTIQFLQEPYLSHAVTTYYWTHVNESETSFPRLHGEIEIREKSTVWRVWPSLPPVPSITPSLSCGPFRELKTMFEAGKRWVEELEKDNPNLSLLARAHSYLVEHPVFLFVGAGIFLWVHTAAQRATADLSLWPAFIKQVAPLVRRSLLSFHQDGHLLPQSGGGWPEEDHQITAGADRKCEISLHVT